MPADADGPVPGRVGAASNGAGAYMVACDWTPPTVSPSAHPRGGPTSAETAPEFLAAITTELEARGLTVQQSRRQGVLAEIAASSPAHPERGSVGIGCDGFLIWERWAPAANSDRAAEIVRLIAWVLMRDRAPATGVTP